MSRPDRPYRATYVGATRTVHYDYETKEARKLLEGPRDQAGQGGIPVTVTIRKPLKPGTPVCWLNVFNDPREFTIYGSKEAADEYALANQRRVACIPVYLPGEGAPPGPDAYYKQWRDMKAERDAAKAEVERKHDTITAVVAQRDQAYAEVERLTKDLGEARADFDELSRRHGIAVDRAQFAEAQRDAAQAQAMPAGKVVYGASGKFGINRDFQTIEFADKRLRDTYRKSDGWTWFTRVDES